MSGRDLDRVLAEIDHRPDGSYRALVSATSTGNPVGGYAAEGTRADDPNDRVPHEDRRSLRGPARVSSPAREHRRQGGPTASTCGSQTAAGHYLRHHILDFGLALGVYGYDQIDAADGFCRDRRLRYRGGVRWSRSACGGGHGKVRRARRSAASAASRALHFDPFGWVARYPYAPSGTCRTPTASGPRRS